MLETILKFGIGTIVLAFLGYGLRVMGLTPPDFQIARACFSIAALLSLVPFGAWIIIAQWPISKKIIIAFIICGTIGAIWAFLIGRVESREKTIAVRPILRIRPVAGTVRLKWPDKSVFPSKQDSKSPLSVLLTNVGNARAIDVEMVFRAPLGTQEIRAELQSSGVFTGFQIEGDKVTLPLESGKQYSNTTLLLANDDVRAIDAVDFESGHNEKRVEYPIKTRNGLVLWLLSRSYRLGQLLHSRWDQDMATTDKLFQENDQKKWSEYFLQQQRENVFVCPEITVTISYKDIAGHKFSETHVIKSIYQPTSKSMWVIDGEQRYLHGGFGILSFEDKENPSEGFFNMLVGNDPKQ